MESNENRNVSEGIKISIGEYNQYQYQRVKLKFDNFYSIKILSAYSSLCTINEKEYGWSSVMFFDLISQDSEIGCEKFRTYWKETSICPDPRIYEVENSKWLENEARAIKLGCKHFIVLGHDNYIEVLAKDWNWVSLGALENW